MTLARIGLLLCLFTSVSAMLNEEERLKGYHARNYTWPIEEFSPNTEGWRRSSLRRMAQVERITGRVQRTDGWMSVLSATLVTPNFTENGFGLTRAPQGLVDELKERLHSGLPNAKTENYINVLEGDQLPLFVPAGALSWKVLNELKPVHEEWSGVSLTGASAYGLRAYRDTATLHMHVDKIATHVISCILHVDHSEDSEPWPLFIEDLQGNTHEVVMESGDMLFYESAKCIHGRPRPFKGSWYSSLFVHYHPTNWLNKRWELEPEYAMPPHWNEVSPADPNLETLAMSGTGMYEPDCPDRWCATKDSLKMFGPAKKGIVITTGGKETKLKTVTDTDPPADDGGSEL
eukprot:CAMPEP_0119014124 /NCGR_PEP_ID=MMETSP1176-20130426/9367_1 /TAXON_ID=265551 /ORGANISM="Synedropsis recta cf, Strain CCMP1620" /LENGTH=346 /DNA_ID=CAMNT_0006967265 /DNA_START=29 /DNA_END=1069 /DNA_ORIENTATION=+